MTVYILNSNISGRNYDGVILREEDFHPCHSFFLEHPNILPETVNKIVIKGVVERCQYLRALLRYCDYMLVENGIIEIYFYNVHFEKSYYVRSRNQWQYELSLVFGNRILLKDQLKNDKNGWFKYIKTKRFLPAEDTIDRWSFGIVSSGRLNDKVVAMIQQIEALNIPFYEILICGPAPSDILPSSVRILDDSHLYPDIRIPISKKKNYIIEEANYNNLVLLHDRYTIPQDWYKNMKRYGNYFDLLVCNILDEEEHKYQMPSWGWYKISSAPNSFRDIIHERQGWLNNNKWNESVYIPGGFFVFKKHFGLRLNPYCNWGEMEDVDFCRRAYDMGLLITFDKYNQVYSTIVRSGKSIYKHNYWQNKINRLKDFLLFYIERLRYYNYLKKLR